MITNLEKIKNQKNIIKNEFEKKISNLENLYFEKEKKFENKISELENILQKKELDNNLEEKNFLNLKIEQLKKETENIKGRYIYLI